jgi:hypothetical protein
MYGVDGRRELPESTREDLSGYAGARGSRGQCRLQSAPERRLRCVLDSILLHTPPRRPAASALRVLQVDMPGRPGRRERAKARNPFLELIGITGTWFSRRKRSDNSLVRRRHCVVAGLRHVALLRPASPREYVPHAFPQNSEIYLIRAQRGLGIPRAGDRDRHICSTAMNGPSQCRSARPSRAIKSWSRKSEQGDKWSFCLTAGTLCPANQERP